MLLKELWPRLNEAQKEHLIDAVLSGPPRNLYRDELTDSEWEELRDRDIYDLLHWLRNSNPLPERAQLWLDEIQNRYDIWKPRELDKASFLIWMESGVGYDTDYNAEELLKLPLEDRVRVLEKHDHDRDGLIREWNRAIGIDTPEAIITLSELRARGIWLEDVWSWSMWGFDGLSGTEDDWDKLIDLLDTILNHNPMPAICKIARPLSNAIKEMPEERQKKAVRLLLRLFPIAARNADIADRADHVTAAINDPAGHLAEALIYCLVTRNLSAGDGLPVDLLPCFNMIIEGSEPGHHLGRVILASRLRYLHTIDPGWTRENLLPYFKWEDPAKAKGIWQGYLWSPRIHPELLYDLKSDLLETFRQLGKIGQHSENLAYLFGALIVDLPHELTHAEIQESLGYLDDHARSLLLRVIKNRLEAAEDRAPILWEERIKPLLERTWPRGGQYRGEATSRSMASVAIASGDAFTEAIDILLPFMGATGQASIVVDELLEKKVAKRFPNPTLKLLSTVIAGAENIHYYGKKLSELLNEVKDASKGLENSQDFKRLEDLLIRLGYFS